MIGVPKLDRGQQGTRGAVVRTFWVSMVGCALLAFAACQQKMAQQPYYRPLEESSFFADGSSSRPIEAGTVSRGQLYQYHPLVSGLSVQGRKPVKGAEGAPEIPAGAPNDVKNYVNELPFAMDRTDLKRGMERYTIFCTPCHGVMGDGRGKIVERGFLQPPSYHLAVGDSSLSRDLEGNEELPGGYSRGFGRYRKAVPLKDVPVGYIFEVITRGFGGMPDHAQQIPPEDRWRIAAYVRVLQLSQSATLGNLPKEQQDAAKKALEK